MYSIFSFYFFYKDNSFIKLFNKLILDTVISSERLIFNVFKGIAESVSITSDSVSKYVQKQFTDSFTKSDIATKLASIV